MLKLVFPAAFLLAALAPSTQQTKPASAGDEGVARQILALERAALDRSDRGDGEGFLELSDAGVSYFDPGLAEPIRGLQALRPYYHGLPPSEPGSGEMLNAHVQVAGDVAVLTFRYVIKTVRSGRVTRWNATEVYHRTSAGWRIIHTHWAYTTPRLAK